MKETLKKVFDKRILALVGLIFGIGLTFQFIVFPGLTAADTVLNILSIFVGMFSLLFAFYFIQSKDLFNFSSDKDEIILPGETEYDYIPKDKIVKKKRNPKQFTEVKSEEPFVKTRKKNKPEFPMKPHHTTINKTK